MSNKNQGEGNRDAAKGYNESAKEFVQSGGVERNKEKHTNLSEREKKELREAEEAGKAKAK